MKSRFVFPLALLLVAGSACGGSSSSSDVTLGEQAVATSLAPESNSNFCKNAASAMGVLESAFADENSEEDPEQFWKSALTLAMKMFEDAPNEIRDDAEKLQKGIAGYAAVFAKYDYDMMAIALDPEGLAAIESLDAGGKMTAASDAVDKYLEESCGIPQES